MVIEDKTETDSIFNVITIGNSTTGLDGSQASSLEHIFYNPVTDKVETDRAIETTLNSLYLGKHHKMSSGGENIYFTNLSSGINWYPGWGGVLPQDAIDDTGVLINQQPGAGTYKPSMRVFEEYAPVALGGQPNQGTSIPYSGSNRFTFNISGLGITTMVAETIPEGMVLKYEIAIGGTPAYVQYLDKHGGLNPNELLTWFFDHPLDITGSPANPGINTVSISKLDDDGNVIDILNVCQGLDEVNFGGIRYQTTVLARKFTDENIAYKDELENLPIFYEGQSFFDIYIDITYDNSFEDSDGTIIKPYTTLQDGITVSNPGDRIFIIGDCFITSEIVLPHGLSFYGSDGSSIRYTTYNTASNTNIFKFTGVTNTEIFKFKNIEFWFAGEYAINITNAKQVDIIDCTLNFNGWSGTGLSTISPLTLSTAGYDSSQGDLQQFYTNTIQSLDGGAIYINNTTTIQIIGNRIRRNYNSIKLINCGIGGNGFITRNIIAENIQSGLYLGTDNNTGCQNMIVSMNYSSYNANTGISIIGGINNKFSQNEINGNWNAAFYNLSAVNTTLRDSGFYNNNRSIYNGIGEIGLSKASIIIDEADSTTLGEISINTDATFIIEILDTQVHYTGIDTSSNTSTDLGDKTGIYITQNVGNLADSYKNIIKIDDVGFIGQNYAIDFSDVNVSSLRLSLGDNSYQSILIKTIKDPDGGMYSELPYSNHVMQVPEVDIKTDLDLKKTITLCEGQNGHVINVYFVNELESIIDGNKINIIQKNTNKIQLRGLELTKVYINGVLPTANDISSLNNTINATFSMTDDQFENFLISDVGLDGRNTLPDRDYIWKQQFGPQANTSITTNIVTDANKNIQPFRYIPQSNLIKGKEYIWTHDDTEDYILGFWNNGNSSTTHNETDVFLPVKWLFAFKFTENLVCNTTDGSVGSDIDTQHINGYSISNSTILALRYSHDNYIYLLDITNGSNTLIAKTNTTQVNIRFSFGGGLNSKLPIIRETSSIWDIVHDLSASENKEWIDGINSKTVLRSNMKIYPNQKITLNFNTLGKDETIGMLYNGAYYSNSDAPTSLRNYLKYSSTTDVLIDPTNAWIFDTSASNYDSVLEGWGRGASNSLGEISFIYKSDSSIELFSETENQTIATLRYTIIEGFFQIYFGATNPHTLSEIPVINKYAIINTDIYPYNQTWYYIESPDGTFHYPLFKNVLEARGVDVLLGGAGTHQSHTYVDDPTNTTWYMPNTNSVMNNTDGAPQNGIWNNLTNILWNVISTNPDNQYLPPSFSNQEYTYLENTLNIIIQYRATDSFSYTLTGLPPGWTQTTTSINGNAESLTYNGYGNLKTYVVYVTKANSYGSVVGTITINIKPNLASNEFQIIEQETIPGVVDDIKFTLDYGLTQIDPGFIGYNATPTYKFYLDDSSVESNDVLDIVLESDNSVVYSTGVTNIGSVSNEGAYLQFVIPQDVPPVKLRWTSGTGEVIIKGLNINGSTYSPPVTGITHEGPDTLNVNVADSSNWYSIDTQFANDKRILLTGTLLKEIASELGDINSSTTGSSILIGLKEPSWLNSKDGFASSNTGFLHEMAIKISRGSVGEYLLNVRKNGISNYGNFTVEFTSLAEIETNGGAFIEIIPSGDAFRMCITNDATNLDIVTRTEARWGVNKITTGNQNFNITNIDLMIYFDKQEEDFNYSTIDWTQITSIPTLIDLVTTNWYRTLDFKASNQYTILPRVPNTNFAGSGNRSIIFPISMNDFAKSVPDDATNSTKFSNDVDARPWSIATVFMIDGHGSDQIIFGQIEGASSDQDNIMFKVNASRVLSFHWGRYNDITGLAYNAYNIKTLSINTWYGVYIEHTGCRYNAADATSTNLNKALHFKLVDLTTGVVTDNPGNWSISGHRTNHNMRGDFMIGGRTVDKSFNGKIASCIITTQLRGADYPVDAEVSMMVRDPVEWLTNYKIGQDFRVPNDGNVYSSVFALNDNYSSYSTQVWLMGDTSQDSYPAIKNYVYPTSTTTQLDMTNMLSTDIEAINIPELN